MQELVKEKFDVIPLHKMFHYHNPAKVVVCMRHDVDVRIFKALQMALLENKYDIQSTYFMLATAPYYGEYKKGKITRYKCMEECYKKISGLGHEVGIHNDLLAIMILEGMNPFLFNSGEISFYRSLGIPVVGTASHGSSIAMATVPNYEIFSDFAKSENVNYKGKKYPLGIRPLQEFGFEYEAYFLDHTHYFSDLEGKWVKKYGFDYITDVLEKSEPGDRIQILTHPVWWGK